MWAPIKRSNATLTCACASDRASVRESVHVSVSACVRASERASVRACVRTPLGSTPPGCATLAHLVLAASEA
eukprot:3529894-Alexandrium_andersonii.AAC.1